MQNKLNVQSLRSIGNIFRQASVHHRLYLIQNVPHLPKPSETNGSFSHIVYLKSQFCIFSKIFGKLEINARLTDIHPKV